MKDFDSEKIKDEIVELLKQHKKEPEDIHTETEAAMCSYFTDEKMEDLAAGLVEILKQHLKQSEGSEAAK